MGEESLISKKELLERYGMSYGALYRWKRMGLIPEEWFLKKATVTGQETFFPEALITQRIELILRSKNEVELDALSRTLREEEDGVKVLILETPYGDKSFRLDEIKKIRLSDGKKELDLTKELLHRLKED